LTKIRPNLDISVLKNGGLTPEQADHMIENCIGVMPLPLGLGTGFKVNGKNYVVPMAIEEPSVIAACSTVARMVGENSASGF
jgi:hydroxymethylglutaryl-CoA reductase